MWSSNEVQAESDGLPDASNATTGIDDSSSSSGDAGP